MNAELLAGIDVGSTTVKIVLVQPQSGAILYSGYRRHNADQRETTAAILSEAHDQFPHSNIRPIFCGSGAIEIANRLGASFVQEVVACGILIREKFPEALTAVEIGGQDAKLVFFRKDPEKQKTLMTDMRMNGSCAGGTGAFIDQVASLLSIPECEFNSLAEKGTTLHEISGRCGVFAKTDIQPLLNSGISRSDIALSSFHAIARQIIGGMAQGMEIRGPVVFLGGPLTFNPVLVRVFEEKLGLGPGEAILPAQSEILVAYGAALAGKILFSHEENSYNRLRIDEIRRRPVQHKEAPVHRFFSSPEERRSFSTALSLRPFKACLDSETPPDVVEGYLGIDGGSTTSKFVLIDRAGKILEKFYAHNRGEPLRVLRDGLLNLHSRYAKAKIELRILGAGSTGYGEKLLFKAFKLDFHTVETLAHATSARAFLPEVSFILDVGGQDMKAIFLDQGIPVNFILNEACSAGCGSFLETYADSLGVKVEEIAELAFQSESPSRLGSRCTVFMNSSIITEQKNGRPLSDILAGLCHSVVENALTKVLRISNLALLGDNIVVQGGTFKNDAVFRAFQMRLQRNVVRPDHPGEMGAYGIALLTKAEMERRGEESRFSFQQVHEFSSRPRPSSICRYCTNHCKRTILEFHDGSTFVTGNKCEKGEIVDGPADVVKSELRRITEKQKSVVSLVEVKEKLISKEEPVVRLVPERDQTIGIPRVLEFFESLPFWRTFFLALGYRVIVSPPSSAAILSDSLRSVSSDTICLPAKIVHGHIQFLLHKKVDRIFFPLALKILRENSTSENSWMCPVIQGYSEVVRIHDEPQKHGVHYDAPAFQWESRKSRDRQIMRYARGLTAESEKTILKAIEQADKALAALRQSLVSMGQDVLAGLGANDFAVVVAGRPYHSDSYVNHDVSKHFTELGIPVLDLDSIPGLETTSTQGVLLETNNTFHTRLLAAAIAASRDPRLEFTQLVSFGCGHDAILSDEIVRILESGGKTCLILKLDEGENRGPLGIRIRSFVESIRNRRRDASAAAPAGKGSASASTAMVKSE